MRVITLLLAVSLGAFAQGQTRYVTDRTIVELRRGPGLEYLILRNLEAGDRVDVLEETDDGYSRVRVADGGTEGWLLTRFLTPEPIARERLAIAERNLATARQRVAALEAETAQLKRDFETVRAELEEAQEDRGTVNRELADLRNAAANVVEIRDQNEQLRERLVERDRELEELAADNRRLAARDRQNWFVVGAAVLLAGIVIGLVAPSLRRRRRTDW
jgi:SH3 domain protein